jgi:hypothetical protein
MTPVAGFEAAVDALATPEAVTPAVAADSTNAVMTTRKP